MTPIRSIFALGCVSALLCACTNSGGYFQNDGPPSSMWGERDFSNAPNAVVRIEQPHKAANRPYTINGVKYRPMTGDAPLNQTGIASWYGKQFHGKKTSIGERYDMFAMTAAHTTMELPSYAKVTNLENGKTVIVRVNDRGPFLHNRVIDLSYAAASKLGYVNKGTAKVKVERIRRADIKSGRFVTPGNIQQVEPVNQSSENDADLIALESIINESASKNIETTTIETITSQPEAFMTVESSEITSLTITETKEDLTGAVDLTEVAKHSEMVSTESTQNVASNIENPQLSFWSVQAGVFSSESNAKSHLLKLKAKIEQPIEIINENGRHRVLIGPFKDQKTASEQADLFGSIFNEKFIIFEQK